MKRKDNKHEGTRRKGEEVEEWKASGDPKLKCLNVHMPLRDDDNFS